MPTTKGYVGTIETETRDVSRIWFGLTATATGADWVKIGVARAWFTMSLETADRPAHMAGLTLLLEAMRNGLEVDVSHGGAASFSHGNSNDTFEVDGVRVLRKGLHF